MSPSRHEPIALVGIGCRFPGGVVDPGSFWRLLRDEVDAIAEVPAGRFDLDAVYHPEPGTPGRISCRFGGFLAEIDRFDAPFFGVSPREAVRMDPQQRLLLEAGWEALEDAGMPQERIPVSRAGVFLGMMANEYEDLMYLDPGSLELHGLNGGGRYGASGRLSFGLGLEGPSLTVDTACSSSLVTVHLACHSLRSGECDLALAGGAHLILHPNVSISLSQANILARDGRCKFGDARADGFVRGEGVGLTVLRRLADALADGDRIYAVIRGSAVNSDGRSNGVMATPSRSTQEAMLREAYRSAGVSPGEVSYIEAHGTGTSVGDRVELEALGAVLAAGRPAGRPCRVGSVKTNIGHTEGASGVAGLIKLALSLAHRTLPKSLHFVTPNPSIPWADLPLTVQAERTSWPDDPDGPDGPAIGGVNSFGLSGTNAHLVLAEPPARAESCAEIDRDGDGEPCLVPLSARSPEALRALVRSWCDRLAAAPEEPLAPLARAAALRRSHLEHRLAVVAASRGELRERLEAFLAGEERPGMTAGVRDPERPGRLAFVFPGQGSQWIGMGRELLAREPVFRASMERSAEALAAEVDWGLFEQLAGTGVSRLDEIDVIQPTLFAIQVALAALWRSWGVEPAAVVGHSLGEVAAAHVAGALSLEDAARVICRRSRLLLRVSGRGAMALVDLPLERAAAAIAGREDRLSIAVNNSPGSVVLSGDPEAIDEVVARLEAEGVFCRRIKVDVASHSPQMDPLRGDLLAALAELRPRAGSVPVFSTVTGETTDGAGFDAGYWVRNLRQPVLFAGAVERLLAEGFDAFLEISPHPLLLPAVEQSCRHCGASAVALPSLRRGEAERGALLGSLGALHARGHAIDWARLHPGWRHEPWAVLPTYPWQRERFWLPEAGKGRRAARGGHPLLGPGLRLAEPAATHVWETVVEAGAPVWLDAHRVHGMAVLPGAAYVEMALAAAAEALGERPFGVADLRFENALAVPREGRRIVQVILGEEGADGATLRIFSRDEGSPDWIRNATGALRPGPADGSPAAAGPLADLAAARARCGDEIAGDAFYASLRRRGLDYGPPFQGIESLHRGDGEAVGRLARPPRDAAAYRIHPARLDAAFQLLLAALPEGEEEDSDLHLPVALREVHLEGPLAAAVWVYARLRGAAGQATVEETTVEGDVALFDDAGNRLLAACGLRLRRRARDLRAELARCLYEIGWERSPRAGGGMGLGPGLWLLLADSRGISDGLRTLLEGRGERCLQVSPAARYGPLAPRHLGIDPAAPDDFVRLLAETGGELPLRGVVHLWSLDVSPSGELTPEALERARTLGCVSVLHLVQALVRRDRGPAPRLWLVTDRAQAVDGAVTPVQAPLVGLGRVIAAEHPELGGVRIDIDVREAPREALFGEIWAGGTEDEVALRGGERLVARLERREPAAADTAAFRGDATYLITGGLGGLGLSIARWMAGRGARNLVLMGRRGPSAAANAAVAEIEALGARVLTAQADVARPEEMARLLAEVEATLPPLRGVLHAAGVLDDGILLELTAARFRDVLAPKVEGAWNLHRLTRGHRLDFFVLFSSAAALLGTRGQGNYAAANAFLDALAHHRRSLGLPAQSIAWGAWARVGLAAASRERGERLAERGIGSLLPEQGHAALEMLLHDPAPQVAVMAVDWPLWARHAPPAARLARLVAAEAAVPEPAESAEPVMDVRRVADTAERQRLVETLLRREAAAVLRLPSAQIDELRSLTQLGLDSLMALELKGRIDARLGAAVQVTRLLKGLSFKQLAEQVWEQLGGIDVPVPAREAGVWEEIEL